MLILSGTAFYSHPTEAKGKKRWRIIRLTPRAEEIIKQHVEKHPEGVLFRNEDDNPWTAYAVACRFGRLKTHLGEKFCATAFRHGVAQDMLEHDADPLTVAEILGHANGQMLATVYSHMNKADGHLDKVLKRRAERNQDGIDR
jgi:integrase